MANRFKLIRELNPPTTTNRHAVGSGWIALIGINPSEATQAKNDPTTNRLNKIITDQGYRGYVLVNQFSFVSAEQSRCPDKMERFAVRNNWYLESVIANYKRVVLMWGRNGNTIMYERIRLIFEKYKRTPWCFGTCKNGQPTHPLLIRNPVKITPYEWI